MYRSPTKIAFESLVYVYDMYPPQVLEYIGHTSPECLLHPGEPLNVPDRPPKEVTYMTESSTCNMVLKQKEGEIDYFDRHKNDSR